MKKPMKRIKSQTQYDVRLANYEHRVWMVTHIRTSPEEMRKFRDWEENELAQFERWEAKKVAVLISIGGVRGRVK